MVLSKSIHKIKQIKWHIWIRDIVVICAIFFAVNAWQSRDMLDTEKLNIIRIALDYSNVESVQEFAKKHNISSQILLGHEGLKRQFQIQGYPTYYILDEHQKVLSKSYGYSTALGLRLRQIFSV